MAQKSLSRAEQKRRAAIKQAEVEATAAVREDLQAGKIAAVADLPPILQEVLDRYRPRDEAVYVVWQRHSAVATRLVVGYAPTSPATVRTAASHISAFLCWYATSSLRSDIGVVITAEELLAQPQTALIDAFARTRSARTRSTIRSALKRALSSLSPEPAAKSISSPDLLPPLSVEETAQLIHIARNQPNDREGAQLCLMVGSALGAGLAPKDMRELRPGSFQFVTAAGNEILTVRVPGMAPLGRVAVVRHEYVDLIRHGLELHERCGRTAEDLVIGTVPTRKAITGPVQRGVRVADRTEEVRLDLFRLRTTWLVAAMCSPIPMRDLLRAAGLRSARSLTGLLQYCPPTSPQRGTEILAAISTHEAEPSRAGDRR